MFNVNNEKTIQIKQLFKININYTACIMVEQEFYYENFQERIIFAEQFGNTC